VHLESISSNFLFVFKLPRGFAALVSKDYFTGHNTTVWHVAAKPTQINKISFNIKSPVSLVSHIICLTRAFVCLFFCTV